MATETYASTDTIKLLFGMFDLDNSGTIGINESVRRTAKLRIVCLPSGQIRIDLQVRRIVASDLPTLRRGSKRDNRCTRAGESSIRVP